jgi:hypothetical protein
METILLLFIVAIAFISFFKVREGFNNPMTESQTHQGDIQTIRKQLDQTTTNVTDELLNDLQSQVNKLIEQTKKLQNNVPDGQVTKYS